MTAGAFNDAARDGDTVGERLVVLEIRRIVEEIIRTVIHRLPIGGGHLPARGTPADAPCNQAGLASQNLQQMLADPAILGLVSGEEGQRRLPDLLRHMDKVHEDDKRDVPLLRKPLEMFELR